MAIGDLQAGQAEAVRSTRQQVQGVAWFVALCVAVAALGAIATGAAPALVPFALAFLPAVIAVGLASREGPGAVGHLLRSLTIRPADRRWYLVLLIPLIWAITVVIVAVVLGEPSAGLFDNVIPAILIVPLVVLLPALAEELAWRSYAVPRLLGVVSPLVASLVLAVPWTVMHLVLQVPGAINEGTAIWAGVLSLFAYSVVLTWVFLGTGGSALMSGLVHAGLNGVVPIMSGVDLEVSWALRAVVAAVIAAAVIALGGFRPRAAR